MRELKFRVWVDEYNEDIEVVGKEMIYCDKMGFKENTYNLSEFFELTELGDPIMQYTGLKDKKRTKEFPEGQEIYEGDIVSQEPTTRPMAVHWVEDRACFQPFQLDRDIKEWEVIGNIYEDYKPLEEEK